MNQNMITLKELLRDPQYRAFFIKPPRLPDHYLPANRPWKLLVLKPHEDVWRSKRYGTYTEAFAGLKKMLPIVDNAAINCPALSFQPPSKTVRLKAQFDKKGNQLLRTIWWKPQITADMDHHDWCPHCRRPSIFQVATLARKANDHLLPIVGEGALRCMICGASERIIDLRNPQNAQKWDSNRPKVY